MMRDDDDARLSCFVVVVVAAFLVLLLWRAAHWIFLCGGWSQQTRQADDGASIRSLSVCYRIDFYYYLLFRIEFNLLDRFNCSLFTLQLKTSLKDRHQFAGLHDCASPVLVIFKF